MVQAVKTNIFMDDAEKKAAEEYSNNGVDLPELQEGDQEPDQSKDGPKDEIPSDKKDEQTPDAEKQPDADKPDSQKHLDTKQPEEQPKRRSVYDDLKDERVKRQDAETRLAAEAQARADLQTKFDALSQARPGEETKEAERDIRKFAEEKGADPELVEAILVEARKGLPQIDPALTERLERFEAWEKQNAETVEKQRFENEFRATVPNIKEHFPTISDAELTTMESKLDELAHSKEWHDKSLDYIVFKNKSDLAALVSPKKRGMEDTRRQDVDFSSAEFDPNADLSKMSPEAREKWYEEYSKAGKQEGLLTDANGRKSIL